MLGRPTGQGQQGEVNRIIVIAEVKHAREAGAGELRLVPVPSSHCARSDSECLAAWPDGLPARPPRAPARPRRSATPWAHPGRGDRGVHRCRAIRPSRPLTADGPAANWPRPSSSGRRPTRRLRPARSGIAKCHRYN